MQLADARRGARSNSFIFVQLWGKIIGWHPHLPWKILDPPLIVVPIYYTTFSDSSPTKQSAVSCIVTFVLSIITVGGGGGVSVPSRGVFIRENPRTVKNGRYACYWNALLFTFAPVDLNAKRSDWNETGEMSNWSQSQRNAEFFLFMVHKQFTIPKLPVVLNFYQSHKTVNTPPGRLASDWSYKVYSPQSW